jgi:DNA/RNA-binding domain of Phe-tRNA-synthetase-like protein
MKKTAIEPVLRTAAPDYTAIILKCSIVNSDSDELLWQELDAEIETFRQRYVVEDINKLPGIYEMRQVYKKLGKDPNRYRPSAEALCRRILKSKDLYRINTLVDLINMVSIHTGFSIGGFDCEKIAGDLKLGVGSKEDVFHAIGRGLLNIEGIPVYRDESGGIGTPTSDEERTKIGLDTTKLLLIINSAGGTEGLEEALSLSKRLLITYSSASDFEITRLQEL